MLPTDVILESGNSDFVYMSRMNTIYYMYVTDDAKKLAQK